MPHKTISIILGCILLAVASILIYYFATGRMRFTTSKSSREISESDVQIALPSLKTITWYQISLPLKNDGSGKLYFKTNDKNTIDSADISVTRASQILIMLQNKKLRYLDKYENRDYQSFILTEDFLDKDSVTH